MRPEWLYYDGGPRSERSLEQELEEARATIAALEAELREASRLNRQLTTRLQVDGVGDNAAVTRTGKTGDGHV